MKGRLRYFVCSRASLDNAYVKDDDAPHFIFAMNDGFSEKMIVLDEFLDRRAAESTAKLWNRLERRRAFETNSWV
jgi:hypothetical protein